MSADGKEENPDPDRVLLPSGQLLTPLAAPGARQQYLSAGCQPQSVAGGAMATVVSPDGKTMLVLTSGYTIGKSPQYIFVYGISALRPDKKQTIKIQNSFTGSRYKSDTLIFIVEDDAQDGADHMDAHRSTTYVVGPYVRQNTVVTQRYTTVNLLRTIEDLLGLQHLSIYTATQPPMTEVFDLSKREWTYDAVPSLFLYNTCLPIPQQTTKPSRFPKPTHSAAYWAEKTAEFDFSKEDNLGNPEKFDRIIWQGLKGNVPYPAGRIGADLRKDRRQILQNTGLAN